jgi:hypothetical protein
MMANGWSEFSALPGEILSDENLDRIVGGKSVRKRSNGRKGKPRRPKKRNRGCSGYPRKVN